LENPSCKGKKMHSGVLEFTAQEGTCGIPYWMMQNLLIEEGSFIKVKSATLPKGTYVKIQPHETAFIEIANPKAVLENKLRNFSALTEGDIILIEYNHRNFYLNIIEVKPAVPYHAISIVETDVNLEFAPPLDESKGNTVTPAMDAKPLSKQLQEETVDNKDSISGFKAFTGQGYTLSGKSSSGPPKAATVKINNSKDSDSESEEDEGKFKPFSGSGNNLKS